MVERKGDGRVDALLAGAFVADEVAALRPDYRVLLVAVEGLVPGGQDDTSTTLLARAEDAARRALADCPVERLPHVAAWREAYRGFGAKPQRTRNSLEALLRRASSGLPQVNPLTDIYNAISVLHRLPLGGEDLDRYQGPPRLLRATGVEAFDTVAGGVEVVEHPEPGEVVWCDGAGVTCRRWNWRQARRTRLQEGTTTALFVIDALDPVTDDGMHTAADELVDHLARLGPRVRSSRRLVAARGVGHEEG
ncbi:phenylalanine--tRNA ligase beta subunit-related protein [Intrasporangium sp.]|uniref:B3/B4 domain-containing protein n=1 Tax=Intrasporangium sp. TaxID=1925024 RepID=UPI0032213AC8